MRLLRERLDRILDSMTAETRAAFVLHELEEMTLADIATLLGLPQGTVASRLRRARRLFFEAANPIGSDDTPEDPDE